ncbi:TPA: hypothetical protein ACRR2I_004217 [Providencia rettgeri]
MDKIKRVLEHQIAQHHRDRQLREYRDHQFQKLCDLVESWIAPLTTVRWHQMGADRLLHLALQPDDTLVLRFAPQWQKKHRHVCIALSIFNTAQPRQRTLFVLVWYPKTSQWHIRSFKRKNHRLPALFYRRTFRKSLFETCLIDFLHPEP